MAFYILISKLDEDAVTARYSFTSGTGKAQVGTLSLDKRSGEASLIRPMEGDEVGHYFNRASVKVIRAWKDGDLPDILEWAS